MEKSKKRFSALSIVLLIIAVILLLAGGIGGTRAALTESDTHTANLAMQNIGVELYENGKPAETLLADIPGSDKILKVGKDYKEEITVVNTGSIDCYTRVILYKYWKDETGKKTDLDPSLIELTLGSGWKEDTSASTNERTVLYYTQPLAQGATSAPAVTAIRINGTLAKTVTQETTTSDDGALTTVTNTYKYNGYSFGLKAEVDAVQTHNAEDAIKSAWGKEMSALGIG